MANTTSSSAEDGNIPSPPISKLEDLIPMSIPSALNLFLFKLDQCRRLIAASQSSRNAASESSFDTGLNARDKKAMDEALKAYWKDVQDAVRRTYDQLRNKVSSTGLEPETVYPFATEMDAAAFQLIFVKVVNEVFQRHIAQLEGAGIAKISYFFMNADIGPDSAETSILGESLIPLIISKAEEFIAALVRTSISIYPNALGEPPIIPNDIYRRYRENLASSDIERWQADQKVTAFIKGSPDDWRRTIRQWTGIDIGELGADWDMIVEMIQRRHAIIHNGGRVDNSYLHNVSNRMRYGLILGAPLISDNNYLTPAMFELETWVICLAFRWTKHFFKEKSVYGLEVNDRAMQLARAGRWSQALAVLDSYLMEPLDSDTALVILAKINRAFCLQELGRDSDVVRREVELLEIDTLDERMGKIAVIGKYALLKDYPSLTNELQHILNEKGGSGGKVLKNVFRNMLLIKRAMNESSQVRKLIFGVAPKGPQSQGSSVKRGDRRNKSRMQK